MQLIAEKPYSLKDQDILVADHSNPQYVLRVRDLPIEEKPREKLLQFGPKALGVS
jgi:hypothetical protein